MEDNRADIMLLREALTLHALPASLHILDNGEHAIHFIDDVDRGKEPCPQLVILDLNLPRKTGKEVLIYMRQSRCFAHVPVLIASSSAVDEKEMERLGGDAYFQKPTDYEAFMKVGATIRSLLRLPGVS